MTLPSFAGPLVAGTVAFIVGAVFFNFVQLPDLFPLSSVILPALLTGTLALGIGMLLPDALYFTNAERLEAELRTATGLGGYDPQRVLSRADEARGYAKTLRAASVDMNPDIAKATTAAAEDLDELATRILKTPHQANSAITVITRAGLVVDAVTDFVDFKHDKGAKPKEVEQARGQVINSLIHMSEAANDVQSRLARVKLTEIDVATEVADGLFGKGEK